MLAAPLCTRRPSSISCSIRAPRTESSIRSRRRRRGGVAVSMGGLSTRRNSSKSAARYCCGSSSNECSKRRGSHNSPWVNVAMGEVSVAGARHLNVGKLSKRNRLSDRGVSTAMSAVIGRQDETARKSIRGLLADRRTHQQAATARRLSRHFATGMWRSRPGSRPVVPLLVACTHYIYIFRQRPDRQQSDAVIRWCWSCSSSRRYPRHEHIRGG